MISDRGKVATRYDERWLSNTKLSYMYTPGSEPVTFSVDGVRFGCALGIECHYPEVFLEYERLDVDCVLFSTHGTPFSSDGSFSVEVQGHASANSYWISYATTQDATATDKPSGIVSPTGDWTGRCNPDEDGFTVVDLDPQPKGYARPWRRSARSGIYEPQLAPTDSRSTDRTSF